MINLAGDENCDIHIQKELQEAGVEPTKFNFKSNGEVPSHIVGFLDGWIFIRAWYYWVVKSDRNLLLFKYADKLHEKHGNKVRVNGDAGCQSPRDNPLNWTLGISLYHVDNQEGLNSLVNAIKTQTRDTIEENKK